MNEEKRKRVEERAKDIRKGDFDEESLKIENSEDNDIEVVPEDSESEDDDLPTIE